MPTPDALEGKFWKALKSDLTMMLALAGVTEGHTRPMTAQLDGDADRDPPPTANWSRPFGRGAGGRDVGLEGHDVFAAVHGDLCVETDRAMVERLWIRFVAVWHKGGKDKPDAAPAAACSRG